MLDCKIITSEDELQKLVPEWRALHSRLDGNHLTDPDRFLIWWDSLGKYMGLGLHVIIGRREGILAGVLPLTLAKKAGFIRILLPPDRAGYECDVLCETEGDAHVLWKAARQSPHYDFARILGAYPETHCEKTLAAFAKRRKDLEFFHLRFEWPDSAAWKASLSKDRLGKQKRNLHRLEKSGPVVFARHEQGPLAVELIDDMLQMKVAALMNKGKRGSFDNPHIKDYFRAITQWEAENSRLCFAKMKCGDQIIAYLLGSIYQGWIHGAIWTYKPEWASASPTSLLLVNTLSWAIDNGLKGYNFMYTAEEESEKHYKRQYANLVQTGYEYSFSNSLRGRLLENLYFAARSAKRRISAIHKNMQTKKTALKKA